MHAYGLNGVARWAYNRVGLREGGRRPPRDARIDRLFKRRARWQERAVVEEGLDEYVDERSERLSYHYRDDDDYDLFRQEQEQLLAELRSGAHDKVCDHPRCPQEWCEDDRSDAEWNERCQRLDWYETDPDWY